MSVQDECKCRRAKSAASAARGASCLECKCLLLAGRLAGCERVASVANAPAAAAAAAAPTQRDSACACVPECVRACARPRPRAVLQSACDNG